MLLHLEGLTVVSCDSGCKSVLAIFEPLFIFTSLYYIYKKKRFLQCRIATGSIIVMKRNNSLWCLYAITVSKAVLPNYLTWFLQAFVEIQQTFIRMYMFVLKNLKLGIPGWLSGLAPAFGPGRDPGVPGSSPTSGSWHGACFSLCLCLCPPPLSLCLSWINKINKS